MSHITLNNVVEEFECGSDIVSTPIPSIGSSSSQSSKLCPTSGLLETGLPETKCFLLYKYYILFDLLYYLPVNHPFVRYKTDSFVSLSYTNYNTEYYANVG